MKIQFLGAVQTVTGSRFLVSQGEERVLLDCGLFQGFKNYREKNWSRFPIDPATIDAVVLSHAHIDHSGYLPRLIQDGFRGPVYCTQETRELCAVMLPDAGYLQEEEANYANKKKFSKHAPALPLFTEKQARASLEAFRPIEWNQPVQVTPNIQIRMTRAGHILGASHVVFEAGGRKVLFSGDIGRAHDPMIGPPTPAEPCDVIVMESTYGNRRHSTEPQDSELRRVLDRTLKRGGVVVIPSFAVGRAQTLLFLIEKLIRSGQVPRVPVYLNSPMAQKTNEVFQRHSSSTRLSEQEMSQALDLAVLVESQEDSIALNNRKGPMIIIAGSGMATGGRVLHHLKAFGGDPKNTILFTGFQVGGTRGDQIVRGAREVKIHGEYWPIRADVDLLEGLSAHGDQGDLIQWLSKALGQTPNSNSGNGGNGKRQVSTQVYLVHGEPEAADTLRQEIAKTYRVEAKVPDLYQVITID